MHGLAPGTVLPQNRDNAKSDEIAMVLNAGFQPADHEHETRKQRVLNTPRLLIPTELLYEYVNYFIVESCNYP